MTAAFDVAVVGGSLAGSAAAAALARAGAAVVVLEKSRFPRPKICGSFLSHEALPVLERMGALGPMRAAGAETIGRFTLVRPEGRSVEGDLPAPVLSLSRERLDSLVAAAAAHAGATQRFGTAVLSLDGDLQKGFRLRTSDLALRTRIVLGAWGRYSPLDGQLERPRYRQKATLIGFGKQLSGSSSRLEGRVVLHLFKGGYLGLSRVEGEVVNLAALATPRVAQDGHHDLRKLLSGLKSQSRSLAADLEGLSPVPGPVLLSEPVHLGLHGSLAGDVLLVGDAAGVIDPYTGTGMALALLSGEAAAAPVLDFLAGRLDGGGLKRAHAAAHRAVAGSRFFWSRLLRRFFTGGVLSRLVAPSAAPLARWAVRATRG
ncbi:MAG TPA: FAD-dependent monooxygenase [Thermoanaerobaculia bacterium]|nr:FAD-dependent monooxygenase [Thermoanaerobaculia bacterium]